VIAGSKLAKQASRQVLFSPDDGSTPIFSQGGGAPLRRIKRLVDDNEPALRTVLVTSEPVTSSNLSRFVREFELAEYLDRDWALRPLELVQERGHCVLVFEDPGGEPLSELLKDPISVGEFLRLSIDITSAVGQMHRSGLVHKDIKPGNILVHNRDGKPRLTGFGISSRVPRERQPPEPPKFIAGTLPYMAPEQTGRMNRSVDSRSDLYALGIIFYQTLTGRLPFDAVDAMEWIHCHIARQPASVTKVNPDVPLVISAIIDKLLKKPAEARYQTAAGLEYDLRRCLADWDRTCRIDSFPLGELDVSGRLLIPEKLYGRERDIDELLAAFDRVLKNGTPEWVLVSGYSGIGKSAVVNELHKVLVPPRAIFAAGKFEQYKRDVPYATLAQAFRSIIRQLLSQEQEELKSWRDNLIQALDSNGSLITDLIPELKLIIGEQPAATELPPLEARARFQLVFRRFIGVFARPEHPLALFLDDLQWLDEATLELIEGLLTHPDVRHLLLVGAYRDNEVSATHPLIRRLEIIRENGARVRNLVLSALGMEDLGRLVTDSFHCESQQSIALAGLIFEKTAGNPFFAIQFIATLVDEGLIAFDHTAARWCWDLSRIDAKGYTDNVVELMADKLHRLPNEAQEVLQRLACLGNSGTIASLSMICGYDESRLDGDLWEARRAQLVIRSDNAYRFIHDRVQEAAYSLIPQERRAEIHLSIGRLLVTGIPPEKREDAIFEIVSQFERCVGLISLPAERDEVAELNLMAGKRAKGSAAYASALAFFRAGVGLLDKESWDRQRDLIFALELNLGECEFLTGQLWAAEERLVALSTRARTAAEQAAVASLRVDVCTALDQPDRAVGVCLEYLRTVGIAWSPHPTDEEARLEYERIWSLLGARTIEDIIDLPLMENTASLAILDVLAKVLSSAWHTDANLVALTICKRVSLSLEHGNCDASCQAYVMIGSLAGQRFGDYQAGYRFGRLGCDLVDVRGLKRFEARTFMCFASFVLPWAKHVDASDNLLRRSLQTANATGDLTFVAYSGDHLITHLLAAGAPLDEVQLEAESGLAFAEKTRFGSVIDRMTAQLGLIKSLRGLLSTFGSFDDGQSTEQDIEYRFANSPNLAMAECRYWIRKLQARFLAGDYATAIFAAERAQSLLWTLYLHLETADYHYYGALAHAASYGTATSEDKARHHDALDKHHGQLRVWAACCPENFKNRESLIGAEIARIEGRVLDAMELYEQAIHSARANGFVHNEAIAYEMAAEFYDGRGLEDFSRVYRQKARDAYRCWRADGKVHQLQERYRYLRPEIPDRHFPGTIAAPVEHLDLATVIKVSQALSGEMELRRLIDTLVRLAVEHAGAERGVLLLSQGSELWQEAQAVVGDNSIAVHQENVPDGKLSDAIVQYVMRSREVVIVDDAVNDPAYSIDSYVMARRIRSILCLPLITESKVVGVLYLENNLAPGVFTPSRTSVLKLLALQAAISLENAYLYKNLADAEKARDQARSEFAHVSRVWSLGALTASIAHEINQPLASIITNGDTGLRLLARPEADLDSVKMLTKRIVEDGRRAAKIIDRVRTMASRGATRKSTIALAEVASESAAFLNRELHARGVSMSLELASDLPDVVADRTQLQQVIVNLLINAMQALAETDVADKRINIRANRKDGDTVCCMIEDNGPGIDAEYLPRLFDGLFTTKETGMGLGLPIARSIIEAHEGSIRADNESGLGGARFIIELPVEK
jgi:predicted ATPase/signal transduction histidine kinase